MREEFLELLARADGSTSIDEACAACQTMEEWELLWKVIDMKRGENAPRKEPPDEWKARALEAFQDVPPWKISVKNIQIKLKVGYSLGADIQDWLMKVKWQES